MPVDVLNLLTPSDYKLVSQVRRTRGDKAGLELAKRIARRAGQSAFEKNERIAEMVADEQDYCWPPRFVAQPPVLVRGKR